MPGVGHPPYPERAPTSGRSVLGMILGVLGLAALYLSWRIPAGAGGDHGYDGLILLLTGLISAYLMNHERVRFSDTSALIAVRLTGWFWLALLSAVATAFCGALSLLQRQKSP